MYGVTGSGITRLEAVDLLDALGLRIESASLPLDADGDEDPAGQVSCMAFDLDDIGELVAFDEVPLVGPGAKINVTCAGDGTATQVYYAMRRV